MRIVGQQYTEQMNKMNETMQSLHVDTTILVLKNDGFLPEGVLSPSSYFVAQQENQILKEKKLYYDFIEVPEFWEIRSDKADGAIYDMGQKKASIYFQYPYAERYVQRVEWFMESGFVYKIDYYGKYGFKYKSEWRGTDNQVDLRVFYSSKNQEVVVEQPKSKTISIHLNGEMQAYFMSYEAYYQYAFSKMGKNTDCMVLVENQEQIRNVLKQQHTIKFACFTSWELLDHYEKAGGKNGVYFVNIPKQYPKNHGNGEILILTDSDQIEGITVLINGLPHMNFHIAANTEVSDKLINLGKNDNVQIYPGISNSKAEELWQKCDIYLDINHFREIRNAVDQASQRNLVILGYENTIHHREMLAEHCVIPASNYHAMVDKLNRLIDDQNMLQEVLLRQQKRRIKMWNNVTSIA